MLDTLYVLDTVAKQRQEQMRADQRKQRFPRMRTR
jgi:hypothetical protein